MTWKYFQDMMIPPIAVLVLLLIVLGVIQTIRKTKWSWEE